MNSETSFVGSSDGAIESVIEHRNTFFLVLQGLCGATHLLSHTKNTIDRLGNTASIWSI